MLIQKFDELYKDYTIDLIEDIKEQNEDETPVQETEVKEKQGES